MHGVQSLIKSMNLDNEKDSDNSTDDPGEDTSSSFQLQPLSPPPGSNLLCNDETRIERTRLRHEWDHLDQYDVALYLDAIETAIERGLHQRFALYHFDEVSEIQAHDTCGFYLWHRIFILAYENMLRSLENRFLCLTIPFWNIYRDYDKQELPSDVNACRSYATCSKIINDLGGLVLNDDFEERTFFGTKVDGLWHFKPPLQNLRDDNNRVGMIRYDLWFDPIPKEVNILSVENITRVFATKNRAEFWEILHHSIHDSVHDTIGGFMRTPASPIDPLFMPWHSTMDLYDYIWETCHSESDSYGDPTYEDASGEKCIYTSKAKNHFLNISLHTDTVYMKLNSNATIDIRDDPQIGKFFSHPMNFADVWEIRKLNIDHRFRYTDIPEYFIRALENNPEACPNGLNSILPSRYIANGTNNDGFVEKYTRKPPTFSNEELMNFKKIWIEQAQSYFDEVAPSPSTNDDEVAPPGSRKKSKEQLCCHSSNNIKFICCLLFEAIDRDTIERWAIDGDTFLAQVVQSRRYDTHPLCRDLLSNTSYGPNVEASQKYEESSVDCFSDTKPHISSSGGHFRGAIRDSICHWWSAVFLITYLVSIFVR